MSDRARAAAWWTVVAVVGLSALWYAPSQARQLKSDVEVGSRGELDRELQPARTVGLDPRIFVAAERVIPADATYLVLTGNRASATDPDVLQWVRRFARYRLFPRRLAEQVDEADWILSYGADVRASGVEPSRIVRVGPGLSLVEVAR